MSVQETLRPSLALRYRPARTTEAEAPGREREHARVARARHRGARVSGPEERPAQPDAWVERRRSLSGQQKHLSGADQASRRQFNWRGPRAAQAHWLASGASGQPRESGAPPGAGRPCRKRRGHVTVISRAQCGLRTPSLVHWSCKSKVP
jgi:hypothetical protein